MPLLGRDSHVVMLAVLSILSKQNKMTTHEEYINAVRQIACNRLSDTDARQRILDAKLVYGVGSHPGARGVCYHNGWSDKPFLEICATGEESNVQLAGTTVHECAHVMAGYSAGHGPEWKSCALALGLVNPLAAGQLYEPAEFDPDVWNAISALEMPSDGKPTLSTSGNGIVPRPVAPKPCPMGRGTRGGISRGPGSGSRLRLWECACPVKVRVASDQFRAHCDICQTPFLYKGK